MNNCSELVNMKKLIYAAAFIAMNIGMTATAVAEPKVPSRVIHLVYDDSGSMIVDPESGYKTYVDTWCQAKYAMEVLTAMLGENDSLNVYYMSSYELAKDGNFSNCKGKRKPKGAEVLSIHGSLNAGIIQQNVNTVQENTTMDGDTPFCPVVDAFEDLKTNHASKAKENKWLVVVTDGKFEDSTSQVTQNYYNEFTKDANVVVLSIGKSVDTTIVSNEETGLLIRHARTSQDVLNELTQIGNRIFQRNTIPVSADNKFKLDIPMRKLIVFAQGQNIDISSLTNSQQMKSNRPMTSIRASQPSKNQATIRKRDLLKIDEIIEQTNGKLNGQLATFDGFQGKRYFAPDMYHVDIEGGESQNIQIYYDAFVGIGVNVKDSSGNEIDPKKVEQGKYHIDLQFENPDTHEKIESNLLKNPKTGEDPNIKGIITITGMNPDTGIEEEISRTTFDMSTDFELEPGQRAKIEYEGRYLEYNTLSSKEGTNGAIFFPVKLPNPSVSVTQDSLNEGPEHASYGITGSGFKSDGRPLQFKLDVRDYYGKPYEISDSEWRRMKLNVLPESLSGIVNSFEVKKKDDRTFEVIPHFVEGNYSKIQTQKAEITITPEIDSSTLDVAGGYKALIDFHNDIERDELLWKPLTAENYCIVCDGISPKEAPVKVSVSLKEHELTDEIWNSISEPSLNLLKKDMSVEGFGDCKKSETKGVFECGIKWSELALNTPFENEESVVSYEIAGSVLNMETLIAVSPTEPNAEQLSIGRDISFGCWLMHYLVEVIIGLITLIILIGEIIKPRIPKFKVKGKTHKLSDKQNHKKDDEFEFKSKRSPSWIPYIPQTGSFSTPDQEVCFRLKATKPFVNKTMQVTNLETLKSNVLDDGYVIMVDGERINKDSESCRISVGENAASVTVKRYEYTIHLD